MLRKQTVSKGKRSVVNKHAMEKADKQAMEKADKQAMEKAAKEVVRSDEQGQKKKKQAVAYRRLQQLQRTTKNSAASKDDILEKEKSTPSESEFEHDASSSSDSEDASLSFEDEANLGTSAVGTSQGATVSEAKSDDDGGPIDKSLLKSFEHHIAKEIWEKNKERGHLRCINHWNFFLEWDLTKEPAQVVERVKKSGLYNLTKYCYNWMDVQTISAFVERWQPETNTSHMPFGEMTITLEDVSRILQVPIDGTCVYKEGGGRAIGDEEAVNLLVEYLGVDKEAAKAETNGSYSIRLNWIIKNCKGKASNDQATEADYDRVARAYLFYLMGCTAFADKSGTKTSVYFLNCLLDMDLLENKAWGMAILAYLYRQLGLASRAKVKQITGCLSLLMAWIYDHFPMIPSIIRNESYRQGEPLIAKWEVRQQGGDADYGTISIRELLDDLTPEDVCWDSYKDIRDVNHIEEVVFYNGILLFFDTAEPYYPGRVLRQFGRVQTIPTEPMMPITSMRSYVGNSYKIIFDNAHWCAQNWRDHLLHINSRSTPVVNSWDCTPGYISWFRRVSHPIIQHPDMRKSGARAKPLYSLMDAACRSAVELLNEDEADIEVLKSNVKKAKKILKMALLGSDTQVQHEPRSKSVHDPKRKKK